MSVVLLHICVSMFWRFQPFLELSTVQYSCMAMTHSAIFAGLFWYRQSYQAKENCLHVRNNIKSNSAEKSKNKRNNGLIVSLRKKASGEISFCQKALRVVFWIYKMHTHTNSRRKYEQWLKEHQTKNGKKITEIDGTQQNNRFTESHRHTKTHNNFPIVDGSFTATCML